MEIKTLEDIRVVLEKIVGCLVEDECSNCHGTGEVCFPPFANPTWLSSRYAFQGACPVCKGRGRIGGVVTHFSLVFGEEDEMSHCFFMPVAQIQRGKQSMIMVGDYEKMLKLLLSHPKISELEYDEKGNCILAVFDSPLSVLQ